MITKFYFQDSQPAELLDNPVVMGGIVSIISNPAVHKAVLNVITNPDIQQFTGEVLKNITEHVGTTLGHITKGLGDILRLNFKTDQGISTKYVC